MSQLNREEAEQIRSGMSSHCTTASAGNTAEELRTVRNERGAELVDEDDYLVPVNFIGNSTTDVEMSDSKQQVPKVRVKHKAQVAIHAGCRRVVVGK